MATSDQSSLAYKVGDHVTFTDAITDAPLTGTIVATAQHIVLDGSQVAYTVELDAGPGQGGTTLVGIAHTDVTAVDATEPATAETSEPNEAGTGEGVSLGGFLPAQEGDVPLPTEPANVENDEAEGETEAGQGDEED